MPEPTRQQLEDWDRLHYWHAFTQMEEYQPFILERAQGCTLYDLDGNAYLDGVSSIWCNVHGHRHPKLDAALRAQLDRVAHVTSLGASNPTTIQLARRLAEITPAGLEHVFFSDSGASSVEVALKMALQYWRQREDPRPQKTAYLCFREAYHGDTLGSVSVSGVARFREMFAPLLFETIQAPVPDTYRLPPGVPPEDACQHYLTHVEQILQEHHHRIAALVIEPLVQGAAGMVLHPPGFLKGLRELTRRHDVLLIADEVAVGMGRTGKMFACQHEDVEPDFLCLAKGLTGGYLPLAATLTTEEIWSAFLGSYADGKTFFHGHTYGGNPLGAAVALATLQVFEEEQTLRNLQPKIARLEEHLASIRQLPHVGDARNRGFIARVELVQDKQSQTPFPWTEKRGLEVCQYALQKGVWLRPLGNVVVIMPPLAITLQELDQICEAVYEGVAQLVSK